METLLAQLATVSPEAAAFLAGPLGGASAIIVSVIALFTAVDAFFTKGRLFLRHLAWCVGLKARLFPPPPPDPHVELERLAKLEPHLDEAGRARLGPMRARLAAAALAQLEKAHGPEPVEQDAQAAQREAVEDAAAEGGASERAALEKLAAGDVPGGLAALAAGARAEDAPHAERWRRLGAMAYPLDTALAAEAYAKAQALDGSDPWDAIYLTRLHARAGDLAAARRTVDAALAALPAEAERDRSVLNNELGDLLLPAGDREGALAAYRAGMAIAEDLAARDPGNAGWARDLSVSHEKFGDALRAEGDREGALAAYRAGMAIREDLAARDPGNAGWARDLFVSHNKVGDALTAEGDREGALETYRASMAIAEDLAARDPGNAQWARDVWVSQWRLAGVEGSGVSWADVAASLAAMKARGVLAPPDEPFLAAARAKAAQAAE